ncbi:MAG: divalent-cation tolerance protein CutA [Thermoplasmatota archaeon]
MNQVVVLRTAVDTEKAARALARRLIEDRLAACVHVTPTMSTYRWKGNIEEDKEWLVEAKARPDDQDAVWDVMLASHPYETPCVECLGEATVPARYMQWVNRATNRS